MMTQKNIFILLVLNLWTALCNAQFRVWRVDTRSPTQMRSLGVFAPRGASRIFQVTPDVSMYNHAHGADSGISRDNDGYVSTTSDEEVAVSFLIEFFHGDGYVYEVAAGANFIRVAGTLLQFDPYPEEEEYAALGGFRWDQVIGWTHYTNGREDSAGMQYNNEYNGRVYNNLRPSNGDPRLAGFPPNHQAWRMPPWNAFAQGPGCGGSGARSLDSRNSTCTPDQNAVTAARKYIDEECLSKALCGH